MAQVESIGADLGGTKLAVGVVDGSPGTLWSEEVPSKGYSQESVVDLLAQQIGKAHAAHPAASTAGVGIPATLDHRTGHAISTVNLDLEDLPIRDMLTERVGLPVAIDNDGNLAMLAEALYGAARGTDHALLLTIGTGIGGGIWLNGEIYRGATGAGAELGHLVVEIDGTTWHGSPEAIARDASRDEVIHAEGYTVLRIPASVVFDTPAEAVRRVEQARRRLRVAA